MPATMQSRWFRRALRRLYRLTGFDLNNPYFYSYASSSGGEVGVGTGFGNVTLLYVRRLQATAGNATIRRMGDPTSGSGWAQYVSTAGLFAIYGQVSGSSYVQSATYELRPTDVGKLLVFITRVTAVPGNVETIVNRIQLPSVAISAYAAPSGQNHVVGSGNIAQEAVDYVASLDFRGAPTVAQLQALCDTIVQNANVPTSFTGGTVTHRHSLVDALVGTVVTDGQAGPASLTDTTTTLAADALTRSSAALTVREVPVSEGRQAIGLTGWSTATYLESTGLGIQGSASGFTVFLSLRTTGGAGFVVNAYGPSLDTGWTIYLNGAGDGMVRFYAYGMGDLSFVSISECHAGKLLAATWDGTTWRLYVDGVQVNTWTGGFARNTTGKMRIGLTTNGNGPPDAVPYALAGCDQGLTATEVWQVYDNWRKSGRLALPAGKTNPHVYDFALDLLNATVLGLTPSTFADRAGTEALTRVGGFDVDTSGLSNFSSSTTLRSMLRGLEGSASGFWVGGLVIPRSAPGGTALFNHYYTGALGYTGFCDSSGFTLGISNGTAGANMPTAPVTANALNHVAFVFTGSAVKVYTNGVLRSTTAHAGYAFQANEFTWIGVQNSGQWPMGRACSVRGIHGGKFVPTDAEIATAASASIAAGTLVDVPSKTDRSWRITDDVLEAGGMTPSIVKERVSGGDPLLVTDPCLRASRRVERACGWKSTPQVIGARGMTLGNNLSGNMTGFANAAVSYWFILAITIHAKTGSLGYFLAKGAGNAVQGIQVYSNTAFGSIAMTHGTGASYASAPVYTVLDADLNRPLLLGYQWNGSALQAFAHRARNGADITASSYAPFTSTSTMTLGKHNDSTAYPLGDAATVHGVMGGIGSLSLGEYQAAYDGFFASDDFVEVPGKTTRLFSARRAALANGGALAALVDAMGSGESLSIVGAPTISNIYAHAA